MDQQLDALTPEEILADIRYVQGLVRKAEEARTAEAQAAKNLFLRVIVRLERQLADTLQMEEPDKLVDVG